MEGWGKKQRQLSSHSCHVSQSFAIVFAVIWWGGGRGEAESPNSFMLQRSSIIVKCPNED